MKLLLIHNFYQQPGGEDVSMWAMKNLMENQGHQVETYLRHNDEIRQMSGGQAAYETIWGRRAQSELYDLVQETRPDVAIFHNTFPLISPMAYATCRQFGVPVIQVLHNYRLACLNGLFYRKGSICEDCLGKFVPWPGLLHNCYRNSLAASGVVGGMLVYHRARRTWQQDVDVFITLTEFSRRKMIQSGLAAKKIVVQSNFLSVDPGVGPGEGEYALFVGRLTTEKGIPSLLAAWENDLSLPPLRIVGDGELREQVQQASGRDSRIQWLGRQPGETVIQWMKSASLLLFPSEWYEGMPRVIIEAFACGTPVMAARVGAAAEIIADGESGVLYTTSNPNDLAGKLRLLLNDPGRLVAMRLRARQEYETKYTAEIAYQKMMSILNPLLKEKLKNDQ